MKGSLLRVFVPKYGARFGGAKLVSVHASLPSEYRAQLDPSDVETLGILTSNWYPGGLLAALVDRMVADFSPSQRSAFMIGAARETLDAMLSGIYRALFRAIASPNLYARYAQKLWNAYYDNGEYRVSETAPGEHAIQLTHWRSHHPYVCEALIGTTTAIYEAMGLGAVRVQRIACVSEGAPACRLQVRFRGVQSR